MGSEVRRCVPVKSAPKKSFRTVSRLKMANLGFGRNACCRSTPPDWQHPICRDMFANGRTNLRQHDAPFIGQLVLTHTRCSSCSMVKMLIVVWIFSRETFLCIPWKIDLLDSHLETSPFTVRFLHDQILRRPTGITWVLLDREIRFKHWLYKILDCISAQLKTKLYNFDLIYAYTFKI